MIFCLYLTAITSPIHNPIKYKDLYVSNSLALTTMIAFSRDTANLKHHRPQATATETVLGYNDNCLCSPAGYKKSDISRSGTEYQKYDHLKNTI